MLLEIGMVLIHWGKVKAEQEGYFWALLMLFLNLDVGVLYVLSL